MYPYGTKGPPAVGGGLPGLPRRRAPDPKPDKTEVNLKDYRIIIAQANGLQMYRADGELLAEGLAGSALDTRTNMCVDYAQGLMLLIDSTGSATTTTATLYDTQDLSVVSQVGGVSGFAISQGAVSTKLGLVALTSGAELRVFSLHDFISANGGNIGSLTPVLNDSLYGDLTGGIAWNPQGTLLATLGRGTGGRVLLRHWPSMAVFEDIAASTGGGSGNCGFTGKGNGFWYSRHNTTSLVDFKMRRILYDSSGQALSASEVISRSESTFSSSVRRCFGMERQGGLALLYSNGVEDYVPDASPTNMTKELLFAGTTVVPPSGSIDGKIIVAMDSSVNARVSVLRQSPQESRPADSFAYEYSLFDRVDTSGKGAIVNHVVVGGEA